MVELDPHGDAAYLRMIDHLSGPFTGGALDNAVAIAASTATVDWSAREPLLVCGPKQAVGATTLTVRVTITPSVGPAAAPVVLTFAPYSEPGAFLPAYRPDVDATTRTASPFTIALAPLPPNDAIPAEQLFELRVVEGVLGRMLFVLGAEKQRLLRHGREIRAARLLEGATADALDRYGGDLAIPRFHEQLFFDKTKIGPGGDTSKAVTTRAYPDDREPDASYRQRLAVFRRFQIATPARAVEALDTVRPTFKIVESDAEFAVAMKLMARPGSTVLTDYLKYLSDVFLIDPKAPVPANRWLSTDERNSEDAMRARLRTAFDWSAAPTVQIAKPLARVLDLIGRLRAALGISRAWKVFAPTDPNGSRYELGLGIDVEPLPAAEIDALAAAVTKPLSGDRELVMLAASLVSQSSAADPTARWFLGPCGFKTVQPIATDRLYLSHFPMYGMVITPSWPISPGPIRMAASYEAPGDPTRNVVLALALGDVKAKWTGPPLSTLTVADQAAAWSRVAPGAAGFVAALSSVGLRTPTTASAVSIGVGNLQQVAPELVATLQLAPAQAAALVANEPGAAAQLQSLVQLLGASGVVSVLVVQTTANEVFIACTVVRQAGDASVLDDVRVASFRWYVVPITGSLGSLVPRLGPRSSYRPGGTDLALAIAVGTARTGRLDPRGALDPYSVRADLPDGDVLSIGEYELVMNILDRLHPIGVVMNTTAIRGAHVDLDGDGKPDALSPALSRTFRPFRHKRHLGATGIIEE